MTVGKVSSFLQSLRDFFLAKKPPPRDHFCQEKVNRQGPEGLHYTATWITRQEIFFDVMIVYYKAAGTIQS